VFVIFIGLREGVEVHGKCGVSVWEVCGKCPGSVGGSCFGSGWECGVKRKHLSEWRLEPPPQTAWPKCPGAMRGLTLPAVRAFGFLALPAVAVGGSVRGCGHPGGSPGGPALQGQSLQLRLLPASQHATPGPCTKVPDSAAWTKILRQIIV